LKEFVVPMSLEVGRIIRGFESASTLKFMKLKHSMKSLLKEPCTSHHQLRTILHNPHTSQG
ncbi:hypothetical protein ACOKS3_06195, partial [Pseudomonas sp. HS6-2]|uniref:hypothetical protein n=1 Tax=Pseudomonas sp. HS6-2 TaxID=3410986 RepID=UPI003BE77695